jgi:chorismate mutase
MDRQADGPATHVPSHHADALVRAMAAERHSFGVVERAMTDYVRALSARGIDALRVRTLVHAILHRARGDPVHDELFDRSLDTMVRRCVAEQYQET